MIQQTIVGLLGILWIVFAIGDDRRMKNKVRRQRREAEEQGLTL